MRVPLLSSAVAGVIADYSFSPVGLCALINAEDYKPKNLLAVDSVQSRLDSAKLLGAEPRNFQTNRDGLNQRVEELTEGRGADVIIGNLEQIGGGGHFILTVT